jgi:hypothetical protein
MSVPPDKVAAPKPLTGAEKLEKLLQEFQDSAKTSTTDPGKNLRDWLDKSPDLKKRMEDAADKGYLTKIAPLPAGANAGGSYSSSTKTMSLPVDKLNTPSKQGEMIFVMGHEIEHAHYADKRTAALATFNKEVGDLAKTNSAKHDHTAAIGKVVQFYRENEANAHIGGFNAIVSKLTKDKGAAPELKDIYEAVPGRMRDFINKEGISPNFTYKLKDGLTLEPGNTLAQNKGNIDAMGKYYFDTPATLGKNGNQSYPNYYGDWAMGVVDNKEKAAHAARQKLDPSAIAPTVEINLTKLGLTKAVLTNTLTYTDVNPMKREAEAPKTTTPTTEDASKKPRGSEKGPDSPITPLSEQRIPALYGQAESALSRLGPDSRIAGSEQFSNVAASMALQAHKDTLTGIDGAIKGDKGNIIAHQGDLMSAHVKLSSTDIETAKLKPAAQALDEMGQTAQAQTPAATLLQPRGQTM